MAVGLLDDAAQAVARASGRGFDEAKNALRGLDQSELAQIAVRERSFNPNAAVDDAADAASRSPLYLGGGVGAAGAGVGAGFAAPSLAEGYETGQETERQQAARENLQYILDNPDISDEEKKNAIQMALESGLLDLGNNDDSDGGGGGPLSFLPFGGGGNTAQNAVQALIILIVVYYAAKALSKRVSNGGA